MVFVLLKLQYVGKSEAALNLRLNNHRFDVFGRNAIPTCHIDMTNMQNLKW